MPPPPEADDAQKEVETEEEVLLQEGKSMLEESREGVGTRAEAGAGVEKAGGETWAGCMSGRRRRL